MQAIIQPSALAGSILAPASKSSMQRACAAALVARDKTVIRNPGHSNDDRAALGILSALGCQLTLNNGALEIDSSRFLARDSYSDLKTPLTLNCGESGLGLRMFTPILALQNKEIIISGEGSLLNRPMDFFDEVLPQLGVEIRSNHGRLPLLVKGPLQARNIRIDGSLSSQFLTGLLFAYSATGAAGVGITVNNLKSRPYIDLTLAVMRAFDLHVPENRDHEEFYFSSPSPRKQQTITYQVEGDWSGGAFLLVAGATCGNITVKGLDLFSTQADKKIMEALKDAGANMSADSEEIRLKQGDLRAFRFDATDCPDLFPPLVALAASCNGVTTIKGAKRLTHKESNRALTLEQEFKKMGVEIMVADDTMQVKGAEMIKGAIVHSQHDHRIAMACAVAALRADTETMIEQADAINKSYPDFYEHLRSLGAGIEIIQLINQ
jgi:3-phosphoshikimate 1-carboxyvinyltransferase